ncbi:hypothetical protein [Dethiothermospora halolimnae]|uniref:hypothetical protein n=1 Tax=Dethiothermospora halolimnae TaxID=3114390 RepID=UPI003CCB7BBC
MEIEFYFSNIKIANDAMKTLKDKGFDHVYVDINDHYIADKNVKTNLPGTEASTSLSDLVLNSGEEEIDTTKAPLTAADPMVSGIGTLDEVADVNCKLVVKTDDRNKNQVKEIIKSMGGDLENPNVEKMTMLQRNDYALERTINELNRKEME